MCGLAGMLSWQVPVEKQRVQAMCDALAHRGPDGEGIWSTAESNVVLGHRRLAIIDLNARANQPLTDASGRWTIVFNGEIYNFIALRNALKREGYCFVTSSDTEVVLALVAVHGPGALTKLRGMYALALWDNRDSRLILARDPYGIKPIYLHQTTGSIAFASEVRALIQGQDLVPDPAAVVGFFLYGFVPEPHTPWTGVEILSPGTILEISASGQRHVIAKQDPFATLRSASETAINIQAEICEAVEDSLNAHMIGDVPVALFLSSGIDSTAILGGLAGLGQRAITCFSLGFEEFKGTEEDEVPLARTMAAYYGVESVAAYISRAHFENSVDRFIADMDQPTVDGLNTWFVCQAAADAGFKVALSGLGGDELFGGYSSFRRIPSYLGQLTRLRRIGIGSRIGKLASCLAPNRKDALLLAAEPSTVAVYSVLRGMLCMGALRKLLDPDLLREGLNQLAIEADLRTLLAGVSSDFSQISILESNFYMRNQLLRDSDWASMAHGIELRVPLVDSKLTSHVAPLLQSHQQQRQKELLAEVPRNPLPSEIRNRRKTGFSTPMTAWLAASAQFSELGKSTTPWTHRWARHVAEVYWGKEIFQRS